MSSVVNRINNSGSSTSEAREQTSHPNHWLLPILRELIGRVNRLSYHSDHVAISGEGLFSLFEVESTVTYIDSKSIIKANKEVISYSALAK